MARIDRPDSTGGGAGTGGGRTGAGIAGKAGSNVNPIYKNVPPSMKGQIDAANKGYKSGSNMKVLPAGSKAKGQAENQKYSDMIDRMAKSLPVNRGKGK